MRLLNLVQNARLKYTIDRMGLDIFKAEVEKRAGFSFQPPRPFSFDSNIDVFGWTKGLNGTYHYTVFIENGRVQDEPGRHFKTGLREIAQTHTGTFRLTANQHLIIADVPEDQVPVIKKLLAKHKLDNLNHSALRLSSSACVAFPTCGLAMAESERVSSIQCLSACSVYSYMLGSIFPSLSIRSRKYVKRMVFEMTLS